MFLHADNEDSDQTARMHRLICVFVWSTCQMIASSHVAAGIAPETEH